MDKGALLVAFLATKDIEVDPDKFGNQKVSCFAHQDRSPSASANVEKGVYHCFSCDMSGDALELIMIDRKVGYREAVRIAEGEFDQDGGAVQRPTPQRYGGSRRFLPGSQAPARRGGGRFLPPRLRG